MRQRYQLIFVEPIVIMLPRYVFLLNYNWNVMNKLLFQVLFLVAIMGTPSLLMGAACCYCKGTGVSGPVTISVVELLLQKMRSIPKNDFRAFEQQCTKNQKLFEESIQQLDRLNEYVRTASLGSIMNRLLGCEFFEHQIEPFLILREGAAKTLARELPAIWSRTGWLPRPAFMKSVRVVAQLEISLLTLMQLVRSKITANYPEACADIIAMVPELVRASAIEERYMRAIVDDDLSIEEIMALGKGIIVEGFDFYDNKELTEKFIVLGKLLACDEQFDQVLQEKMNKWVSELEKHLGWCNRPPKSSAEACPACPAYPDFEWVPWYPEEQIAAMNQYFGLVPLPYLLLCDIGGPSQRSEVTRRADQSIAAFSAGWDYKNCVACA